MGISEEDKEESDNIEKSSIYKEISVKNLKKDNTEDNISDNELPKIE